MDINVKESYANCDVLVNGETPNEIQFNGERVRVVECDGKALNDVDVYSILSVTIQVSLDCLLRNDGTYNMYGFVNVSIINSNTNLPNAIHDIDIESISINLRAGSETFVITKNSTDKNIYKIDIINSLSTVTKRRVGIDSGSKIIIKGTSQDGKEYSSTLAISSSISFGFLEGTTDEYKLETSKNNTYIAEATLTYKS